jgi:membrane protein implicated in regulation of membrane protease activity
MDSNGFLPQRKRGMVFLIIAVMMLILGETVLRNSLGKLPFLFYWMGCFLFTGLAILFAFLDVAGVQRQAREQQRELLEKTITEIARQKELKIKRQPESGGTTR